MLSRELHWLEFSKETVNLVDLHPSFDGYRLIQMSDIHFGTWINARRLAEVVEGINKFEPDCIAITGDFVSRTPERYAHELTAVLRDLAPKDVTVAVLGNHDHWTDAAVVSRILEDSGITHLQNGVYTLYRDDAMLHLAGVDCTYLLCDRLEIVLEELPGDGPTILLAHEPDYADISRGDRSVWFTNFWTLPWWAGKPSLDRFPHLATPRAKISHGTISDQRDGPVHQPGVRDRPF